MKIEASSVKEYLDAIPEERKEHFSKLRQIIIDNLPEGFEETMLYNMPAFVVPLSTYPAGYHVKKDTPLPFINIGSQKNFIALYHMGVYADEKVMEWFVSEYPNHSKRKLDMGKSCIRFKKVEEIPYELIGELVKKMTVKDWIKLYEANIKK